MTPSQQAKAAGLKTLTQVSEMTGTSLQTLTNWHRDKPDLFRVVLDGCASHDREAAARAEAVGWCHAYICTRGGDPRKIDCAEILADANQAFSISRMRELVDPKREEQK